MKTPAPFFCHPYFCRTFLTALLLAPLAELHAAETSPQPAEPPLYKPAGARAWDFWYAKSGTTYHAFYLRAEDGAEDGTRSVGHATSSDLVHWAEEGVVLRADPKWCSRIATGSVWRGPARWQMLVTAHGGVGGNVGMAESDDLKRWNMVEPAQIGYQDHVVPTDPAWQRHGLTAGTTIAYRILADPYVLPDPQDGWWYMVANCAVVGRPVNQRGCIGLLRSKDGRRWDDCGIIGLMLDYDRPETPQLWQHGDRWYLYFGGAREGSQSCRHNRLYIARSMRGPFEPAPQSHIALPDGRGFYIAKVLADPQGRDVLLGTIGGKSMSLPYPVTYAADGSLTLHNPDKSPLPASTARAYRVGILHDVAEEGRVERWKAGADAAKTDVTGVSYTRALAEPDRLSSFDCLVLTDSVRVPADLQAALGKFARAGRDLVFAGGLAFAGLPAGSKPFTDLAFDSQQRFHFKGDFSVRPWDRAKLVMPAGALDSRRIPMEGWSALGFAFPGQSEFHPLLEVVDGHERRVAWAAGLLRHTGNELKGGRWLLAGVEGDAFYRSPAMLGWILDTVRSYEPPAAAKTAAVNPATQSGPAPTADERIRITKDGGLIRAGGSPFFILGANYCGPFDARLGEFFEKDRFSAEVLDAEFAKARSAGINALRAFSFGSMGTLKAPGERTKAIRDSARRHGIHLMPVIGLGGLSAGPLELADNAKQAAAVAWAYSGDPMILGYDLCNEPYLTQIGSLTFNGEPSPLVKLRPYETLSDLMDRKWVDQQMRETQSWLYLPHWLSTDAKRELLASVSIWIAYLKEHGGLGSTFPGLQGKIDIASSGKYAPLLTVLNDMFGQWIEGMTAAIHSEDPGGLITVGYNTALVALPANEKLDFISYHIYQKPDTYKDTGISLGTFDRLLQMHPGKPVSMGEFGLSNGLKIRDGTPNYQNQALWELLHYLYPYTHGYCGSMKWLLNDWTTPYIHRYAKWWTDPAATAYEQQFGIFGFDGTATGIEKPVAWCLKFFADYLAVAPKPGTLRVFETQNQVQAGFEYRADDAWFYGGEAFASQAIRWDNPETKVVMARWDAGAITLLSTIDMDLELNPKTLVAKPLSGASPPGDWRKISLLKGKPVTIKR